jgi:murein DD-endopeptidase MepM/ murein hydrolase activator NlpD
MTSVASVVVAAALAVGAILPELISDAPSSPPEVPTVAEPEGPVIEHFPTRGVATRFRDDWRNRRSGGRRHEGTDIYAGKGTPIVAVADGFIRSMQAGGKGGYMLWIAHADGWETWYMHLDNDTPGSDDGAGGEAAAFAEGIAVGDFVEAGQVVAYVGDSGNAESGEAHLHFELHQRGRKTNPYPHLADAWDRQLMALQVGGSVQ